MKVSILSLAHLSLCSSAERRLRRHNRDPEVNAMRNKLLELRNVDGTSIGIGPPGATARMSMGAGIPDGGFLSKALKQDPTNPPEIAVETHIEKSLPMESKSMNLMAKAGKSMKASTEGDVVSSKHGSKSNKETSLSMDSKTYKANVSLDSKTGKSEAALLSMDSKAAKAQHAGMSILIKEAEEFWIQYDAKTGKEPSVIDSKADKGGDNALSMDSKAAKSDRMVDMSIPAGKTAKESATETSASKAGKDLSMNSKAEKTVFSMDSKAAKSEQIMAESSIPSTSKADKNSVTIMITDDFVSQLSGVDSKAGKALSMDSSPVHPKSVKTPST
eukprot:scaffold20116_cov69-Cyclotella_meneghiniana.AAC.9